MTSPSPLSPAVARGLPATWRTRRRLSTESASAEVKTLATQHQGHPPAPSGPGAVPLTDHGDPRRHVFRQSWTNRSERCQKAQYFVTIRTRPSRSANLHEHLTENGDPGPNRSDAPIKVAGGDTSKYQGDGTTTSAVHRTNAARNCGSSFNGAFTPIDEKVLLPEQIQKAGNVQYVRDISDNHDIGRGNLASPTPRGAGERRQRTTSCGFRRLAGSPA